MRAKAFSRNKGARNERLLRDHLIERGYESGRIPLSGAVSGFGGDVYAAKNGRRELFELKSRAAAFTKIYDLFGHEAEINGFLGIKFEALGLRIGISMDFELLRSEEHVFKDSLDLAVKAPHRTRTLSKILNMQSLLKGSDYLVIRDDRRPFLFLRYYA